MMQTHGKTIRHIDKGVISDLIEMNSTVNEMVYFNGYID